jgi:hypothetical protein
MNLPFVLHGLLIPLNISEAEFSTACAPSLQWFAVLVSSGKGCWSSHYIDSPLLILDTYWEELCPARISCAGIGRNWCTARHNSTYDPKGKHAVCNALRKNRVPTSKVPGRWLPPPAGIGVVIRNGQGQVQLTAWQYFAGGSDAEEIEALACKAGLFLAAEWCKALADRLLSTWVTNLIN